MHIINEHPNPAIIDFEIPSLSEINFDKLYDHPLVEHTYNTLSVNPGRYGMPNNTSEYLELYNFLDKPLYELMKKLMAMDNVRWPILDLGYKDFDEFYAKKVKRDEGLYISVMTYKPGFSMPWHLDNRFAVLNGIINVNDHETQTCFSTTGMGWDHDTESPKVDHTIIHRGTKNKFQGTAWTNNELNWHCVPNVTVERKIILFGLNLR
jgi:hypothetical protein